MVQTKSSRRILLPVVIAGTLLTAGGLTACGGDEDPMEKAAEGAEEAAEEVEEAAEEMGDK